MKKEGVVMEHNIIKYKAFVTAVESGSLSKTAKILEYSQPGVSRMIADLEKECHASLLERGKNGVSPTMYGSVILPYARKLCSDYDELESVIDAIDDTYNN